MPVTLEVSYFNSYYVKRLADVPFAEFVAATSTPVSTGSFVAGAPNTWNVSGLFTYAVGMKVSGAGITNV